MKTKLEQPTPAGVELSTALRFPMIVLLFHCPIATLFFEHQRCGGIFVKRGKGELGKGRSGEWEKG